jgi:hypothetical protein
MEVWDLGFSDNQVSSESLPEVNDLSQKFQQAAFWLCDILKVRKKHEFGSFRNIAPWKNLLLRISLQYFQYKYNEI